MSAFVLFKNLNPNRLVKMKNIVARIAVTGSLFLASAAPILAQTARPSAYSVPEIDASAGLLAIAAVLAIVAFAWERRRRSV